MWTGAKTQEEGGDVGEDEEIDSEQEEEQEVVVVEDNEENSPENFPASNHPTIDNDLSCAVEEVSRDASTQTCLNIPADLSIPEGRNLRLKFVFEEADF